MVCAMLYSYQNERGSAEMNAATMTAIRQIANEMQTGAETKTARDMALTSHKLNRTGEIATTKDGRKWYWSGALNLWLAAR